MVLSYVMGADMLVKTTLQHALSSRFQAQVSIKGSYLVSGLTALQQRAYLSMFSQNCESG